MRRVIRIDYRFTHNGYINEGQCVPVGETIEETTPENENRLSAVCFAFNWSVDDFLCQKGEPWDWTDHEWEVAGFEFEYLQECP